MLEIEMKFRVADHASIRAALSQLGVHPVEAHVEADHYHNAPDRDFRQTDEAFRLRRIGPRNLLTYKGPKLPGPAKTRTEIEIPLHDGDMVAEQTLRMLQMLKYRPTAVVRKHRTAFALHRAGFDLHVCLDDVDRIGQFVEVEIVAPPERRDTAQTVLLAVVAELRLKDHEPRSYLRMVLEQGEPTCPSA